MRMILFRGFHPNVNAETIITFEGIPYRGDWLYWNEIGELQGKFWSYYENGKECRYAHELEFISETISQWVTTAKDGRDVFESDIVRSNLDGEIQGIVEYDSSHCCFVVNTLDGLDTIYLDDDEWIVYSNKWEF